ncbi:MAG: LCP family protein, partial [Clostridia bacterium]|nr:LCP family protein [Clostridia bacterium]
MAKDNRQKKAQIAAKKAAKAAKRMDKRDHTSSASSTRTSTARRTSSKSKKKNGIRIGKLIVTILALLLILSVIVFSILFVNFVKKLYNNEEGNTVSTPAETKERDNVAYYVLGLMGKTNEDKGTTGTTQMISLVCYDKHAKTIDVLQIPSSTYLGDTERWKVNTIGGVWSNPKPLLWCETCRRQVFESEIKDKKHNVTLEDGTPCNTKITQKKGSAVQSLLEVFNYQYTIPIDNYYIMPQEAFVKLVDLVGGVEIKLESSQKLGSISYDSGLQTIDGEGALEYVLGDYESINGQVKNLVHQRQVYVALFERLFTCDEQVLDDDVIYPLMKSSTPIRTKRDQEISDDINDMIKLLKELNKVERNNIHMYMLPGEGATYNGKRFYSVHKDELCKLLNEHFNPYDTTISEEFLRMTELANTTEAELYEDSFDKLLVEQKGKI